MALYSLKGKEHNKVASDHAAWEQRQDATWVGEIVVTSMGSNTADPAIRCTVASLSASLVHWQSCGNAWKKRRVR